MSEETKKIDDGGPIHPVNQDFGLTKREYFAAKAMQGLIHDILIDQPFEDKWIADGKNVDDLPAFLAHLSYVSADAMIRASKE